MARTSLTDLIAPHQTVVVTQECQGAIIGPDAGLVELSAVARRVALPNIVCLVDAAREVGARVVHCVVQRRRDGQGSNHNARLFSAAVGLGLELEPGSPGASVVDELGPHPDDVVLARLHGIGPMSGTDLDIVLRNLAIRTIVVTGVSVNVAITNFVMDAANLGYQVVLPRDAVAGVPEDYAEDVIDNTLSLLATVTTTAEVLAAWSSFR